MSSDGNVIETEMSLVDQQNAVFEIREPTSSSIPPFEPENLVPHNATVDENNDSLTLSIPLSPIRNNDTYDMNDTTTSIGVDLARLAEKRDNMFERQFKESVLSKLKCDLNSRFYKHTAAKFLDETFGEALDNECFIRWIAKSLDYKPCD